MVNTLLQKVVNWIDEGFSFLQNYSNIIVWGIVAMMIAKMAKFKVKIGK